MWPGRLRPGALCVAQCRVHCQAYCQAYCRHWERPWEAYSGWEDRLPVPVNSRPGAPSLEFSLRSRDWRLCQALVSGGKPTVSAICRPTLTRLGDSSGPPCAAGPRKRSMAPPRLGRLLVLVAPFAVVAQVPAGAHCVLTRSALRAEFCCVSSRAGAAKKNTARGAK